MPPRHATRTRVALFILIGVIVGLVLLIRAVRSDDATQENSTTPPQRAATERLLT